MVSPSWLYFTVLALLTPLLGCSGSLAWHPGCTSINPNILSFWNADLVMGPITFDKIHSLSGNNGTMTSGINIGSGPVGNSYKFNNPNDLIKIASSLDLSSLNTFTFSVWAKSRIMGPTLSTQTIASNWGYQANLADPTLWTGVDISGSTLLNNSSYRQFSGGVFDGRYIYFVPRTNSKCARYDTQGDLSAAASWTGVDIPSLLGASFSVFRGGAFDGRYIYLVPQSPGSGHLARYDTQADFATPGSWLGVNIPDLLSDPSAINFQGAYFDGRYIYFPQNHNSTTSSIVARFDSQGSLASSGSWQEFNIQALAPNSQVGGVGPNYAGGTFDGRYFYIFQFGTLSAGSPSVVFKFDTALSFTSPASWLVFDLTSVSTTLSGMSGGFFDGRYVYSGSVFNGTNPGLVARYDSQLDFTSISSWSDFDQIQAPNLGSNYNQNAGIATDGRYVYFPHLVTSSVARFDTTGNFTSSASWSGVDLAGASGLNDAHYGGFSEAVFDGRYIYLVPNTYGNSPSPSGYLARYDTLGSVGGYNFRLATINSRGGGNSLFGPTFTIASGAHTLNISTQESQSAFSSNAWYHLAVTYDGLKLKMYLNGTLDKTVSAIGAINSATSDMILGSTPSGLNSLQGELSQIQIYSSALTAADVQTIYNTNTVGFCN
jgi:hypothetical protein